MPADITEVAWAAGIFEGEGCITRVGRTSPTLQVKMNDLDIIDRFHGIMGVGNRYVDGKSYVWRQSGKKAYPLAEMLYPWLGDRRQARMEEVFDGALWYTKREGR